MEQEWSGKGTGMEWNGLDGRADPNNIRADIKTDAKERGKVRDLEEKIKKNANFKEKIWRNQYFFVTLHDNKKKAYPRSLPEGKGKKKGKGQGKEKGLKNEK